MPPDSTTARVIFINRFYWPDETATAQLLTDLAEGLAARGRRVTVIASLPRAGGRRREQRRGVDIVRVGSTRSRGLGLGPKALDFATFYAFGLFALARRASRGDAVVALTDPPLIGMGAATVAGLRGARLHHWVQDIYPDVAAALTGRRSLNLLRGWRDGAWRRARTCVTLGSDMGAVLTAAGVSAQCLRYLPNWGPAGLGPPELSAIARVRAAWGSSDRFVIGYSGNLGRVHDLESILALADLLRDDDVFRFVLVGGGPQRAGLEAEARRRGLDQVRFLPPAPRSDLAASLAAADVQLVTLRSGCERYVFPSKLYGIAAVGRPVLFIGAPGSEIARLIADEGLGGAFARTDLPAAAEQIRRWRRAPQQLRTAAAAAVRFAAGLPGAPEAAAAWDGWLSPGAAIDLPPPGQPA